MKNILHIKNMVCNRCIEAVEEEFKKAGIPIKSIGLGEVIVENELTQEQHGVLEKLLAKRGFELLKDQKSKLIDQIKSIVIRQTHHSSTPLNINFSTLIAEKLNQEYTSLSKLFSSVEGITIEKYILKQKVERVKELIIYNELTLSEIAHRVSYSSVAHLSSQFKKETGMPPSEFKKGRLQDRKPLDDI
ncbi:MAG: AraC family transcriptional regulator [Bacteroidota bacterium]